MTGMRFAEPSSCGLQPHPRRTKGAFVGSALELESLLVSVMSDLGFLAKNAGFFEQKPINSQAPWRTRFGACRFGSRCRFQALTPRRGKRRECNERNAAPDFQSAQSVIPQIRTRKIRGGTPLV